MQKRLKNETKNNFRPHTIIIVRPNLILTLSLCSCLETRMSVETERDRDRKRGEQFSVVSLYKCYLKQKYKI